MLTSFIRTVILLVFIVAAVRIMGKRQIGQLQPAELVVTILLSEMAATPMQDNDIPMLNTLIAIAVLVGLEIIISTLSLHSVRLRNLLQGNSIILIKDGVLDQKQMKRLRYTIDDLLEELRQKDVFDISDVEYAVAETDGSLSVLLKSEKQPVTAQDMQKEKAPSAFPVAIIMDGEVIRSDMCNSQFSEKEIRKALKGIKDDISDIFLMTLDKAGNKVIIRKDKADE